MYMYKIDCFQIDHGYRIFVRTFHFFHPFPIIIFLEKIFAIPISILIIKCDIIKRVLFIGITNLISFRVTDQRSHFIKMRTCYHSTKIHILIGGKFSSLQIKFRRLPCNNGYSSFHEAVSLLRGIVGMWGPGQWVRGDWGTALNGAEWLFLVSLMQIHNLLMK